MILVKSTSPHISEFLSPDNSERELLIDYERGGIHLNDPSMGSDYQDWIVVYEAGSVKVRTRAGTDESVIFTGPNVTEVSLTFDQNMAPAVAWVQNGACYFSRFDSIIGATVVDAFFGATSPFLSLDDKRLTMQGISDVLFAYIRAGALYFRVQRERFNVEHFFATLPVGASRIMNMGMGRNGRFEFYIKTEF